MSRPQIKEFIEYFSKSLTEEQLVYLNKLNNVKTERVELYRDFIQSMCYLINDTYLGDDTISTDEHIVIHFNWCWLTNINNFKRENIDFKINGTHQNYFLTYFIEIFYKNKIKNTKLLDRMVDFWSEIFSIDKLKTKSEYDLFIEVYSTQDKYFSYKLDKK
jgi:hypothetical protein